jgi:hypothetical protein
MGITAEREPVSEANCTLIAHMVACLLTFKSILIDSDQN